MADLKTLTQLSEELKLSRGHLEAAVAFEKVDPKYSFKTGAGLSYLYEPEEVYAAERKFVIAKLEEQAVKEREARKNQPVLRGEIEGLNETVRGLKDDMADLFTASDDTKATAAKLLEQNKLIFKQLQDMTTLLIDRFGAVERMVGVYAPVRNGIVYGGEVGVGVGVVPALNVSHALALKSPPEVLEKLAEAAREVKVRMVDQSTGGAVLTPAAGAAMLTGGAQYGPGSSSELGVNRTRPPIAILGLDPSHHAVLKKAYSACFDIEFYSGEQVNNAGFATKMQRMQLILMMVHTMSAKPRALEGADVIRVKGSVSALKVELQRQWTILSAPDLARAGVSRNQPSK